MDIDDHERFTRCWTHAQGAIAGYVSAVIGDPNVADDVLQDVAVALLRKSPNPTDREIDAAMADNICRCGTYAQIREAIQAAAKMGAA